MRRVRYAVAASLDGFIAGPNGETDWIANDPDVDFAAVYRQFDTALIGRRTYEAMLRSGQTMLPGMQSFVFSRTLEASAHPQVTIVAANAERSVAELKSRPGKDIWLFGGGAPFRSLAAAGLVDAIEVALMPAILGGGIPLSAPPALRTQLRLTGHKVHGTGMVSLEYAVV